MDIRTLPGCWIKAKKDFEFEFYSHNESDNISQKIQIKKGTEYKIYAAIKSDYENTVKLIVIQYEKNIALPVEFNKNNWEILKKNINGNKVACNHKLF